MTTATAYTFEALIDRYGATIAELADQDPCSIGTEPRAFLELVEEAGDMLGMGMTGDLQDASHELTVAAAYLSDALALSDDDLGRSVLLSHAEDHLDHVEVLAL